MLRVLWTPTFKMSFPNTAKVILCKQFIQNYDHFNDKSFQQRNDNHRTGDKYR